MPKFTVDELIRNARQDPLFEQEYMSQPTRIRRALGAALFELRKHANLTPAKLASSDVVRLERADAKSIFGLDAMAAFADSTNHSAVILFVDRQTSEVRAQVPLAE